MEPPIAEFTLIAFKIASFVVIIFYADIMIYKGSSPLSAFQTRCSVFYYIRPELPRFPVRGNTHHFRQTSHRIRCSEASRTEPIVGTALFSIQSKIFLRDSPAL